MLLIWSASIKFIKFRSLIVVLRDEFKAVRKKLQIARVDLEYCAVSFCKKRDVPTKIDFNMVF